MPTDVRRRRDEERRKQRHEALLESAARVFAQKGYHATLVSDIALEAGVGQGTIYRYFKDKREILDTLFDRLTERLLSSFADMSATLPSNEAEYRSASMIALERLTRELDHERELAHLIIREGPAIDQRFADKLADVYDQLALLAQFYLEHAIEKGFARPCNTRVVSTALIGIGVWMANLWCTEKMPDPSLEKVIEEITSFAFDGFGLPGPRGTRHID